MVNKLFYKKTVKDIDVENKQILVRVDYNVPIKDGKVADDYRIKASLPTLKYLLEKNCKLVITSHCGRPDSRPEPEFSLKPVAERLQELLGKDVKFVSECIGEKVTEVTGSLNSGEVVLLENTRFYPGEKANDLGFAKQIVDDSRAEIFVQDCFGVAHREDASVVGVTNYLPSVAGFLVEKEVTSIDQAIENPERPLMAIIGGAKISDKIDVLNRFVDIADIVVIGGGMANTFLLAQGINVGDSLAVKEDVPVAREILEKAKEKAKNGDFVFYIPQDGVVAKTMDSSASTRIVDWGTHAIAEIQEYPKTPKPEASQVQPDEKILDIGPFSGAFIAGSMQLAKTVVWNGAMGVTEVEALQSPTGPFSHGTELVVEALVGQFGNRPYSLVGGGDTVGYIESRGLTESFDHISTGGGASMDLLSGKKLPGVEALADK